MKYWNEEQEVYFRPTQTRYPKKSIKKKLNKTDDINRSMLKTTVETPSSDKS